MTSLVAMTFLPIVERELRVAARRKSTYLTRPLAALMGLIVTGVLLFFFPAALVLFMQLLCSIIQVRLNIKTTTGPDFDWVNYQIVNLLCGMVGFIVGVFVLGWVGMLMGLTTKRANIAVLKTFAFVIIIPQFVLILLQIFISFRTAIFGRSMFCYTIVTTLPSLCIHFGFIHWARRKLYSELREVAANCGYVAKSAERSFAFFRNPPVIGNPAQL